MRFCQAFMTELHRHIGAETDVPAGDIGVGSREIGYLFGQWVRLTNRFTGALTGKDIAYGGSPIRREATGYGAVYMLRHMLERVGEDIDGRTCLVSGAGNVALYAMEKLISLGGRVVTFSDSTGFVHDPNGVDQERWEYLVDLKTRRRGSVETYAEEFGVEFYPGEKPWSVEGELALPCATQNEICCDDARTLIGNGVRAVSEGANMPTEQHGIADFIRARVLFAPSKAANAGGVALSGMEMSQNSAGETWKQETLERRLEEIMKSIHEQCLEYGCDEDGYADYVRGANVAGFVKVADALVAYGVV
jgi:glutamate dehydrogenase (NADP+)